MPTQLVFVRRDDKGQLGFVISRAKGISGSTWKATAAWVDENRSRLETVLANAMLDLQWDVDGKKGGESFT